MPNQLPSFNQLVKHALGFDRLAHELDRLNRAASSTSSFPPYNISVDNPEDPSFYILEIAAAGFGRSEITAKVRCENDMRYLVIEGNKPKKESHYVVQMIAGRSFSRVFNLSDNAEVNSVKMEDGVLTVVVKLIKPEVKESETLLKIS